MMAAYSAAKEGAKVTILEKNEKLGKKIFITGKGRCNVTFASDAESFFRNVMRNSKFLYSSFYGFDNFSVMDLFEKNGCSLKTERGDRVFPVSDHSSDIIGTLQKLLRQNDVSVRLNSKVMSICVSEDGSRVMGVNMQDKSFVPCDALILATGGASYPLTGSTGDGYRFAKECGLDMKDVTPSLIPMVIREKWCPSLMGVSLKNVELSMIMNGKVLYKEMGEMLFTHFGVSGPLVLSASTLYPEKEKIKGEVTLHLDMKPALSEEQLDKRLIREFEEANNKQFKNSLGSLFPAKMIPVMIELSGISPEKKCNEISKEQRQQFVKLIKNITITVDGLRNIEEAIITRGGISVKEVNPSTMECKKINGLYIAGEVLDLDAMTGGFNLQIAWSTGYLAGQSAATS